MLSKLLRTLPAKIALGYWTAVVLVFFMMLGAGFDMIGDGAIPVAAMTAPWSLLVIGMVTSPVPPHPAVLQSCISTVGTFVIFPVICGGVNACLLFGLFSVVESRRRRRKAELR